MHIFHFWSDLSDILPSIHISLHILALTTNGTLVSGTSNMWGITSNAQKVMKQDYVRITTASVIKHIRGYYHRHHFTTFCALEDTFAVMLLVTQIS